MTINLSSPDAEAIVIKIEGKISGSHVLELHRAWEELTSTLGRRRLLVDLRDVTHVDGTGHKLLSEIGAKADAEFVADTPLTKYFAEQALRVRTTSNRADKLRRQS